MKLLNQSGYAYTTYNVNLSYIESTLHMLYDAIVLDNVDDRDKIQQVFSFDDKLLKELSVREFDAENIDTFIGGILEVLEFFLLEQINICSESFIIYVDKRVDSRVLCSYISKGNRLITPKMAAKEVADFINTSINIKDLIRSFINPKYQTIYTHIANLVLKTNNSEIISCDEWDRVPAFLTNVADVDLSECNIVVADPDSIIFNPSFLCDMLGVREEDWSISEVQKGENVIGYIVNEIFMPLVDIIQLITSDKKNDYVWQLIEKVYGKQIEFKGNTHDLESFLSQSMRPSFNKLLTQLKSNFYLTEDVAISKNLKKYFESVYFYDKIDHIKNLQVCTSTKTKGTNLGIYTPEKIESQYNLLHWYIDTGHIEHYVSVEKKDVNISKIKILKPPYNYYFLHRYFEDAIDTFLRQLDVTFLKNIKFQYGDNQAFEVDFIIKHNDHIIVIEAKTRLSEVTIKDALEKKVAVMKDIFGETLGNYPINYVVCSQFSDSSLGMIEYYITKLKKVYRPQFNNLIAYDFLIGDSESGIDNCVRCISDPDLKKLKIKISEICVTK